MKHRKPLGVITRGTTSPNRLRRVDSWIIWRYGQSLRQSTAPTVVDLGYGASPITTLELAHRIHKAAPNARIVGLEIDPERVASAKRLESAVVQFARGGFELAGVSKPILVRAFNVLRQYQESDVEGAWAEMQKHIELQGAILDGTCDELGRRAAWLEVTRSGPQSLTLSTRLADLADPIEIAERLPKALIHRNVAGQATFDYFKDLQRCWQDAVGLSVFGPRQRWQAMADAMRKRWPIISPPSRDRFGEISVAWDAVKP